MLLVREPIQLDDMISGPDAELKLSYKTNYNNNQGKLKPGTAWASEF